MSNMYENVKAIDPVRYCSHKCLYCYAKRWQQPEPKIIEKELLKIRGKGKIIFVGHLGDMFCQDVPSEIIKRILHHCQKFDNIYILQTKNPQRFEEFIDILPQNSILLITLETNRNYKSLSRSPSIQERIKVINKLQKILL